MNGLERLIDRLSRQLAKAEKRHDHVAVIVIEQRLTRLVASL